MTAVARAPRVGELALAGIIAFAATLPFLGKAVHQDDWAYIATAPAILAQEGDWLAQETLYQGRPITAAQGVLHPPVWLVLLALGLHWSGDVVLPHLFMALFVALLAVSATSLAARLGAPPVATGLGLAVSPALLVMSGSVMTDLPMVVFFTASLALAVRALERGARLELGLAGLVGLAAALTRYHGLAVIPMLAALPFLWTRFRWEGLLPAAVATAGFTAFAVWTVATTGQADFERARETLSAVEIDYAKCLLAALCALGGSGIGWALCAACAPVRFVRALCADRSRAIFAGLGLALGLWLALVAWRVHESLRPTGASAFLQFLAFATGGIGIAAALRPLAAVVPAIRSRDFLGWRERHGRNAWIALWLLGYVVAAWTTVPFGATRYALPAMPPFFLLAGVFAGRHLTPLASRVALVVSIAAGLLAATADFRAAEVQRTFAGEVAERRRAGGEWSDPERELWVWGELGFRYYLERLAGARVLPGDSNEPRPGDLILKSSLCTATPDDGRTGLYRIAPELFWRIENASIEVAWDPFPVRVHGMAAHAGFYHVDAGFLPFAFSTAPHDRLQAWRVLEPNPFFEGFAGARLESDAQVERVGGNIKLERMAVHYDREPQKTVISILYPGRVSYSEVFVPPDSELEVGVGESARLWLEDTVGFGVNARVLVDGVVVAERAIDSRHVETDRVWHTLSADLGPFAGRSVEITFDTRPLPAPRDSAWGVPEIVFTGFADPRIVARSKR